MSKFTRPFMNKHPLRKEGIKLNEKEAAKSFVSNTFKKADEQSGFSKGIEENKQWAKDNPGKATAAALITAAKWSPWGFTKYKQAANIGLNLIKGGVKHAKKLF